MILNIHSLCLNGSTNGSSWNQNDICWKLRDWFECFEDKSSYDFGYPRFFLENSESWVTVKRLVPPELVWVLCIFYSFDVVFSQIKFPRIVKVSFNTKFDSILDSFKLRVYLLYPNWNYLSSLYLKDLLIIFDLKYHLTFSCYYHVNVGFDWDYSKNCCDFNVTVSSKFKNIALYSL